MEEELLEGIIASVFLIIVALIGFYLPVLASEFFDSHNPYLVLEVAGFLTYSTSEPGHIEAAIPTTQFADPGLEFRIIPPINTGWIFYSYDNKDFLVSIGECIEQNAWDQVGMDVLNGIMAAVFPFGGVGEVSGNILESLTGQTLLRIGRFVAVNYATNAIFTGLGNFVNNLYYYNGNIPQAIFSSALPSLSEAAFSTGVGLLQTALNIFVIGARFAGPEGVFIAAVVDSLVNIGITLGEFLSVQNNEYAHCYYYKENTGSFTGNIYQAGEYFIYNSLLTFPVYYNPEFSIYSRCNVKQLCNIREQVVYDSSNINNDRILKIEFGYYDKKQHLYYYPLFLILDKTSGEPFGYINVSIMYIRQS